MRHDVGHRGEDRPDAPRRRGADTREPDGMAVASFVLGLPGLLVANVFLGPAAVVLAVLVVLVTAGGTVSWVL
ncbi:hypothetical protein [Streptomyces sp. NPDC014733]|uniref:hypothetical protein n=1 Tax=Streptomyces sp. NPDC014733 TaxID=3364885 RepID=UPI0036FF0A58